ncbi:MAG: hypothetical protein Q9217_005557 [Psora testacea]
MGLLMANEAELQAKERESAIRRTISLMIRDIGLLIEEEKLICAIWLFAYPTLNEIGLADMMRTYFTEQSYVHPQAITPHSTIPEPGAYEKRILLCSLLREQNSAIPFVHLHYKAVTEALDEMVPAVEKLLEQACSSTWLEGFLPLRCMELDTAMPTFRLRAIDGEAHQLFNRQLVRHTLEALNGIYVSGYVVRLHDATNLGRATVSMINEEGGR